MEMTQFHLQVERLRSQWKNSYGEERVLALWQVFRFTEEATFTEAVTQCLLTRIAAPLGEELLEAVEKVKQQAKDRVERDCGAMTKLTGTDFVTQVESADEGLADPEFVQACKSLLSDFQKKKITKAQFDQGCDMLDQTAAQIEKMKQVKECSWCCNTGYVSVKLKKEKCTALFRCFCRYGSARPVWGIGPKQTDGSREKKFIPVLPAAWTFGKVGGGVLHEGTEKYDWKNSEIHREQAKPKKETYRKDWE